MGYRSDVKLITTKEGWEKIDKAARKAAGVTDEDTPYLTDSTCWTLICDGKYVLAEWYDIKWYEGYDDEVDAVMRTLGRLDSLNIPYHFLRVGEEYGDVQVMDGDAGWEDEHADMPSLYLKQEIEVEY